MQINDYRIEDKLSNNIFKTHQRYLRSTHIEKDWEDPNALENYVLTPHAITSLQKIYHGLRESSSLRAWRITGDYGSGKSTFALLLANLLNKRVSGINEEIQKKLDLVLGDKKSEQPVLMPILITGSRAPLGYDILKSILAFLENIEAAVPFTAELATLLQDDSAPKDNVVIGWVKKLHEYLVNNNYAQGLLFVIDEAGKYLEFAASRPDQQDIYLLQSLAEIASRSGQYPIYIISVLHQGISSYAEHLSKNQQREWEKVAGRYEEIIWHYPSEQIVSLIANSLDTNPEAVQPELLEASTDEMTATISLGWFGVGINREELVNLSPKIYPIHPTVIPILVKLFANFGQNERSLYSFLLGTESFGLQDFASRNGVSDFYRLHNLFDYARSTFGAQLANLSYHWKAIDDAISSNANNYGEVTNLLKTVGIINLINSDAFIASRDILLLANGKNTPIELDKLEKRHQLFFRGHAGGYCVWPHTSVDLKESYAEAKKALSTTASDLRSLLKNKLNSRPIVARRHYIEKGNLRYFGIRYVEIDDFEKVLQEPYSADGLIVVPLCERPKDVSEAIEKARAVETGKFPGILIAITPPLQDLSTYLQEVRLWEWIERSVSDLRFDKFAREEVSRQLQIANDELAQRLQNAIGLVSGSNQTRLSWYHDGAEVENLYSGKNLMHLLSNLCDINFSRSPRIHNELINRRELSAAGASARLRLCERLFEFSDQPFLGMDPDKHPPEMSMYLSVLQQAGLHRQADPENGFWEVALPDADYDESHCNILPAMDHIRELLSIKEDERVSVLTLIESLKSAPYGLREGLIPLLLAVFAVINEQTIAFYEDGTFIPRITGSSFLRLIKSPETFDIQYYPISNIRSLLFKELILKLGIPKKENVKTVILDIVKPLIIFISSLPDYVTHTTNLSPKSQRIRDILRTTKNPVKLVFHDLPQACDMEPISTDEETGLEEVSRFSHLLKDSVDELRASYPALLEHLETELLKEFNLSGSFETNREAIAERAKFLSLYVTEIRLKSFCLRLADTNLAKNLWFESLANLVCSMPSQKWRDKDLYKFEQEIHKLANQFLRVEATNYRKSGKAENGISVRVALTRPDGEERDQVIHLTEDESKNMQSIEKDISVLLKKHGQVGIAAASEAIWLMMNSDKGKSK